jgi:hypothetical protein
VGVVRVLLWNLFESRTTLAELRDRLPYLDPPSTWISNEAADRFGVVLHGDEPPPELAEVQELIGRPPDVAEEFDTE